MDSRRVAGGFYLMPMYFWKNFSPRRASNAAEMNHVTSKTPLPVIAITVPCPADWDAMAGDAAHRFCDRCGKHVHNLSAMPADTAREVIANTAGHTCVRFQRDEDGRVVTLDYERPPKPRRRLRRVILATLALACSVVATAFGYASRRTPVMRGGGGGVVMGGMPPPTPYVSPINQPANNTPHSRAIDAVLTQGKFIANP